jgi:hypothetical protein
LRGETKSEVGREGESERVRVREEKSGRERKGEREKS